MKAAAETKASQRVSQRIFGLKRLAAWPKAGAPTNSKIKPPAKREKPVPARGPMVGLSLEKVITPSAPNRVAINMEKTPNTEPLSSLPGE